MTTPIGKARGEGNRSGATRGGEEACGCVVKLTRAFVVSRIHTSVARLRTETCYKAGEARRVGTTPRSRSQTASQAKHELARQQITFLSGEICPAPGSRACPKAWKPAVQAVVGEAEVSRGRRTDPAHPMRTGRTERRRARRAIARLDASGAPRRPHLRVRSRRPQVHCPDRDVTRRRCARNHALGCLPEFRRTAARDDPNIEAASADGTTAPDFQPLSNRLVRTRMPGGVGGGRRKPPAYPILRLLNCRRRLVALLTSP